MAMGVGWTKAAAAPIPGRPGWTAVLGSLGGVFLGGVLLLAVWGKMLDPVAFTEVIEIEGLAFLVPARIVAAFAVTLEAFLGFALLLNVRRLWVLVPTAVLAAFFLFLTGRAYVATLHGHPPATTSCGCFGNLMDRTPAEAFWQDFLLLVPPLLLAFLGRPWGRPRVPPIRGVLVAFLTASVLTMTWMAPALPLDDLATRLSPGVHVKDLCAGEGEDRLCLGGEAMAWQLTTGEHVVVIADLKDPAFVEEVSERLEEFLDFQGDALDPRILVLYSGTKDDSSEFAFRSRSPPFNYQEAPRALLRPLYRRLPRTFVVRDGVVTQTFDGLPPLGEFSLSDEEEGPGGNE
ncbi:MAG: MauE/DoxX family redox-associated membrane protein [Planctomycetota bacterium]